MDYVSTVVKKTSVAATEWEKYNNFALITHIFIIGDIFILDFYTGYRIAVYSYTPLFVLSWKCCLLFTSVAYIQIHFRPDFSWKQTIWTLIGLLWFGSLKSTKMAQLVEHSLGVEGSLAQNSLGHCAVSLSNTLYPLLSTGSTQEDRKMSQHDWKIVDCDVKHQHKQLSGSILFAI